MIACFVHRASCSIVPLLCFTSFRGISHPLSTSSPTCRPPITASGEESDALTALRQPSAHIGRCDERVAVDHVRSTLARRGMHVPIASLERALLTPVVHFSAEQQRALLGGAADLLMKNPFAEAETKKEGKAKPKKKAAAKKKKK